MNGIMIPIVMISAGATIIYGSILVLNGSTFSSLTAALFFFCSFILVPPFIYYDQPLPLHKHIYYQKIKEGQVTPP